MSSIPPLPLKYKPDLEKLEQLGALSESEPKKYTLENITVPLHENSDDELDLAEIAIEQFEDSSEDEIDETLEQAVRNIHDGQGKTKPKMKEEVINPLLIEPVVIDDFIRNFLSSKKLYNTLDQFQWYENQELKNLAPEDSIVVPNVYRQNQNLSETVARLRQEVESYKEIAATARSTYDKLRKERDFHRMHHKRVIQEKQRLLLDLKSLKKNFEKYEPMMAQLQQKYENAMKERMLTKLERDKLLARINTLEKSQKSIDLTKSSQTNLQATKEHDKVVRKAPILPQVKPTNIDKLHSVTVIQAHDTAISSCKFHPRKNILATVSDDQSWKLWTFPQGDVILSGTGHTDWISDCCFNPAGSQLCTTSGDSTVKVWDFAKGSCVLSFLEHSQAVWSCSWSEIGDILATGSMDTTIRIWDIQEERCKSVLRGHGESVNHVGFIKHTNLLYSCSGDKTVSIWDARAGLCQQTLFGHKNAVSHGSISNNGIHLASCDVGGTIKIWDIRMTREIESETCQRPTNKVTFDPSGTVLAAALDDGNIHLINRETRATRDLQSGDGSIQALEFSNNGEFLVSAGVDGSFRIFQ